MTSTVYNLLECSVRTNQHATPLEVCEVQNVDQVLDQHLTRPEEEQEEEEEVTEHKATFLDVLKGL
jgi:hypothetical protein